MLQKRFNRHFELVVERAHSGQQLSFDISRVKFIQAGALGGDFSEKSVDI